MSQYVYMPTLPLYAKSKTDNLAMVGIVLSMYGLWQALIRIPLGIISDWLGRRKPFMIVGIGLAGIGAWMMGVAENIPFLIIGRAFSGLAAGTWVLLVVSFNSLFPASDVVRATAMITLIGSVGRLLGTTMTGTLNNLGGYPLAFFVAVGAAGLSICFMLPISETRRHPQRPSAQSFWLLITRQDVLLPSLLGIIVQYGAWSSVYGFFPLLARQLGATDVIQSFMASLAIVIIILGNTLATTIVKRFAPHRLVYLSFILMATGLGIASIALALAMIFMALFCIGLAWGTAYPLLMGMSVEYVTDTERATAMGIHQAIYGIGMFSGPWLSGILADFIGIRPMLGVTALGCLALGLFGTYQLTRVRGHSNTST